MNELAALTPSETCFSAKSPTAANLAEWEAMIKNLPRANNHRGELPSSAVQHSPMRRVKAMLDDGAIGELLAASGNKRPADAGLGRLYGPGRPRLAAVRSPLDHTVHEST